jgi:hypothetical protein
MPTLPQKYPPLTRQEHESLAARLRAAEDVLLECCTLRRRINHTASKEARHRRKAVQALQSLQGLISELDCDYLNLFETDPPESPYYRFSGAPKTPEP